MSGDTPRLTAEMASEILTDGTWQTVDQSRALNAIATGAHVVVPAAVLRELEVYTGSAAEGESEPAFHRFLAIENTLHQLLLAAAEGKERG